MSRNDPCVLPYLFTPKQASCRHHRHCSLEKILEQKQPKLVRRFLGPSGKLQFEEAGPDTVCIWPLAANLSRGQKKCSDHDHTYLRDALKRERRGELLQLDIKLFARVAFKNVPLPALPALHDLTAPAARRIDDEQIKRTFRRNDLLGARMVEVPFLTYYEADLVPLRKQIDKLEAETSPEAAQRRAELDATVAAEIEKEGLYFWRPGSTKFGRPVSVRLRNSNGEVHELIDRYLATRWAGEARARTERPDEKVCELVVCEFPSCRKYITCRHEVCLRIKRCHTCKKAEEREYERRIAARPASSFSSNTRFVCARCGKLLRHATREEMRSIASGIEFTTYCENCQQATIVTLTEVMVRDDNISGFLGVDRVVVSAPPGKHRDLVRVQWLDEKKGFGFIQSNKGRFFVRFKGIVGKSVLKDELVAGGEETVVSGHGLLQQFADADQMLKQIWPQVVLGFDAGKFSEQLNEMSPEKLHPVVVYRVLGAYLSGLNAPQELPA